MTPRRLRHSLRRAWYRAAFDELAVLSRLLGPGRGPRIMLDVGGHHGTSAELFLRMGWIVHSIEPDANNRARLTQLLTEFPSTLHVHPFAASDRAGERVQLYRSEVSTGISSLHAFHPSHEPADEVETTTVAVLAASLGLPEIDLLKIDVEGHEPQVLAGVDWEHLRPRTIVVEFDAGKSDDVSASRLKGVLQYHGYEAVICEWEPVTEYGRFHMPRRVTRLDDVAPTSWGNIVGFADDRMADAYALVAARAVARARRLHPLTRGIDYLRRQLSALGRDGS